MNRFSIQEIAEHVAGKLIGKKDVLITGLEQIEQAQPGQLTFIGSNKYLKLWEHSQASAALVSEDLELTPGNRTLIQVVSADLALAQVLDLFASAPPRFATGVHETAVVDPAAVGGSVTIGDFTTVAGEVAISDHVTIGSHVTIGGGSIVISDVESHQFVSGFPAAPHKTTLQQWASIKKLPDILKKLNLSKGQYK